VDYVSPDEGIRLLEADLKRVEVLGGEEAPSAASLRREAASYVARYSASSKA
jgi:hypothetical protein